MEDNKKERLFILIFCICAVGLPLIVGTILTIIFQRIVLLESSLIICGVLVILLALFRSRRRDSKNYKENKSVHEDHESESYLEYRRLQITLYIVGLSLIVLSVIAYILGELVFHINQ